MAYTFSPTSWLATGPFPQGSGVAAVTLCCWLKLDADALDRDQVVMIRGSNWNSGRAFSLWRDRSGFHFNRNNTLSAYFKTGAADDDYVVAEASPNLLGDTDWHHVAAVFEADRPEGLRLYVDGQRDPYAASTLGVGATYPSSQALRLGFSHGTRDFTSSMAEAAVFSEALPDEEIVLLAAGGSPASLVQRGPRLELYQDLIRPLNHPGVGASVSATGVTTVAHHPRVWKPSSGSVLPVLSVGPGTHKRLRIDQAEAQTAGAATAEHVSAGVELTPLGTAGEVFA